VSLAGDVPFVALRGFVMSRRCGNPSAPRISYSALAI
jgi:hypothetical protein